ncbi:MAG: HNH endonuclease [Ilumatobacter sp.]|nr:HNH endonuclease [Ilumatobacter sp.]
MFADLVADLIDTDDAAITTRLRANELEQRRLATEQAALITEAVRRGIDQRDGHRSVKGYLKANLNWSDQQVLAGRRLAALLDTVPCTGDALLAGHIGLAQAGELARIRGNRRCGDRLTEVAEMLLHHAEHLSFKNFRVVTKRWEALADQDGAYDDRVESRTATVLDVNGELFVNATGGTPIEAAELVAVFDRFVEREFRKDCAERDARCGASAPTALLPRTDAQRRRDAFQQIFRAADSAGAGDARFGPLPITLNVIVSQYDLENALAGAGLGPLPIDLRAPDIADRRRETSTGTPISQADVVAAAIHGRVRRVLLDNRGVITDFGRERRLFTGPLRVAARLMGHSCSHPGCDIASEQCEIDHVAEFVRDRGSTSLANSDLNCRSHNRYKTRAGLTRQRLGTDRFVTRRKDGTAMLPVGRRIPAAEPADPDQPADADEPADADQPADADERADRSGDSILDRLARRGRLGPSGAGGERIARRMVGTYAVETVELADLIA